jgi:electron transfer flavoprotein alpha subunit
VSTDPTDLGAWGADLIVTTNRTQIAEDAAATFASWCQDHLPWAVLGPSTMWGREVTGRIAARLGAGLVGDAIDLAADGQDRLVCWKGAFSGGLIAEVTCRSPIQIATIGAGVLPLLEPRIGAARQMATLAVAPRHRLRVTRRIRDDDLDLLATARAIVAAGVAVPPHEYPHLAPLLKTLGAELAATRKVTDRGWQPRARQIGVTGRSVAPRLYVAVGTQGNFNHLVGARRAETILAINNDPTAPIFAGADIGIVADWRQVVARLTDALSRVLDAPPHAERTKPLGQSEEQTWTNKVLT